MIPQYRLQYKSKMKRQNFQYNYEYYNHLSRSRFSSRTSRRLKSQNGDSISNKSKTRFYHRIEKACTTFSNNDLTKEINLCKREIERLEKEILKKDKIIFEMKEINMHNKEIQSELIEVYRVLYMYEGKIGQYEKEMKKLELAIASQMPQDVSYKVEELLESYRIQNGELGAQIQQKNCIIMELDGRLKKVENKYFNTAWKLSSAQRQISNPLKKRFPHLRNTITMNQTPLLQKQKAMKFRQQAKNLTSHRNEYNMAFEATGRERQSIKFKKVEASPLQQTTPIKVYGGQTETRNAISPNSISFSNNINRHNTYDNNGNKLIPVKQTDYQNSPYNKTEAPLEKINNLMTSNPNIGSQVTISSGVVRRIQGGRVYRQETPNRNPRIDQTYNTPKIVTRLDMLGQGVNQVQNMMKSGSQARHISPTIRTANSQSIYLN